MIKKIISNILKIILDKKIYKNRHQSTIFFIYHDLELFFRSFKIRFKSPKIFLLPTKHILCFMTYEKIFFFLQKYKYNFFLFGGSLLGAARNQGCSAGSAKDLDLAVILEKKDIDILELRLLTTFKNISLRFNNSKNSVHINFIEYHYYCDLAFFFKKNHKLIEHTSCWPYPENMTLENKDIFPLINSFFYYQEAFLPANYQKILKSLFGDNWSAPHKKKQTNLK